MKILAIIVLIGLAVWTVESKRKRQKQPSRKLKTKKQMQYEEAMMEPEEVEPAVAVAPRQRQQETVTGTGFAQTIPRGAMQIRPAYMPNVDSKIISIPRAGERGFSDFSDHILGERNFQQGAGPAARPAARAMPSVQNKVLQVLGKIRQKEDKLREIEFIQDKEAELKMREQRVRDRLANNNNPIEQYEQLLGYKKLKKSNEKKNASTKKNTSSKSNKHRMRFAKHY